MSLSITVQNVSRRFGGLKAVDEVSFNVPAGTFAGIIGPNGAGKTSLFNLISGVLEADAGKVLLGEQDIAGLGVGGCSALGVARTFQTPRGFPSLNVRENVEVMFRDAREYLFGALFGRSSAASSRQRVTEVLARVGLGHLVEHSVDKLSGGEQRMLEIGRQIARTPKLLMLDEPTAGLDREHQDRLSELLAELNGEGITILLVEHNLRFLFQTVEQVFVMASGRLIASGKPAAIASNEAVISAYLGRSNAGAVVGA